VRPLLLALSLVPFAVQAQVPAYSAPMLNGARFRQTIRSQIRTESGSTVRQERSGREGVLVLEAGAGDSGITLKSWFDSLVVWRESGGQRAAPETDGMIGGGYRGTLSPQGEYTWLDQPFIPDEIAEIADLGGVLDDFLPPLPSAVVPVGGAVPLGGGWRLERRSDSLAGTMALQRYTLSGERHRTAVGAQFDSVLVEAPTFEKETGTLVWDPERGPLVWQRQITMSAAVPARGLVKRAVRTQIEQTILLERLADAPRH
jgi:hypothetical protein